MCSAPWYSKTRRRSRQAADRGDVADEDRRAQHPLDQPEEEGRAELVLDQAGQPDRDDEEEADREQQREGDRQAPDPAADLLLLALLVLLELRVGGDRQRPEADLHRLAEGDDAADHRQPPEPVALRPGDERLGARSRSRPSGVRTATAQTETPRIITPSSTACPPTGASRLATRAPSGMRSGSAPLRGGPRLPAREPTSGLTALPPGLGVLRGAALEALDPATGVDQLLLAGVERVALGAELDVEVRPWSSACRTGSRTSSARWRACTRGEFRSSSSPQSREVRNCRCRYGIAACADSDQSSHETTAAAPARCALRSALRRCSAAPRSSPSTTGSGSAAPASTPPSNGPLYDAVVVAAGLACLVRAPTPSASAAPGSRSAPRSSAGAPREVYWTAFIVDDPSPPYPSPADVGYLAFYPLAAAGLGLLVRARARELDWRLWMDGADRRARHRGAGRRLRLRLRRRPGPAAPRSKSRPRSPTRSATSRCSRWSSASSR